MAKSKTARRFSARANAKTGEVRVRCRDGRVHRYLNYGVPECHSNVGLFSSCPLCGHATAELIGTGGKVCADCAMSELALLALRLQRMTGAELGYAEPPWMRKSPPHELNRIDGRGWGETPYAVVKESQMNREDWRWLSNQHGGHIRSRTSRMRE